MHSVRQSFCKNPKDIERNASIFFQLFSEFTAVAGNSFMIKLSCVLCTVFSSIQPF